MPCPFYVRFLFFPNGIFRVTHGRFSSLSELVFYYHYFLTVTITQSACLKYETHIIIVYSSIWFQNLVIYYQVEIILSTML